MKVQTSVEHSQKFTKDCAAKGYFASRAKELLLETTNAFEALVDVASELDKGKSRTNIINKLEEARSGKARFKKAGLALIATGRLKGMFGGKASSGGDELPENV